MKTRHTRRANRRGQSMVEFALLLPLFLLITFGVFEFGRAFYTYSAIANAANEGARYGIINPTDTNGIKDRAVNNSIGIGITPYDVSVPTISSCTIDAPITVTVRYTFTAVVSIVPSFIMNRSSSMRIAQCP